MKSKNYFSILVAFVAFCLVTAVVLCAVCSNQGTSNDSSIGSINGHEYMDLGLSVKWATCNVGATDPSDYGDYFAWGETEPKEVYTYDNCITYGEEMLSITGNFQYDVATANWGGEWRLPTEDEIDELINQCEREWTTLNGHEGYKVTGPNGNSIFLPAAGWRRGTSLDHTEKYGSYWSATPNENSTYDAYCLDFDFDSRYFNGSSDNRSGGVSVRPVLGEIPPTPPENGTMNGYEWVDLGLSVKWATCNVGATDPSDYGDYFAWGETRTKSFYTEGNSVTFKKNRGSIAGSPEYDVARALWGGTWRLPTNDEIQELVNKCKWKWTEQSGTNGYKVKGPNGNSIFLPAAGWRGVTSLNYAGESGNYWSATPYWDTDNAYELSFSNNLFWSFWTYRDHGLSVRPVSE